MITPPRFILADADRAHEEWGCNCGPAALAAICGMTLDEVRPHMGDFELKGYTNQTLMQAALTSAGKTFNRVNHRGVFDYPFYGLCLVQWEGPWLDPGVHHMARYRYTHWIGVAFAPRVHVPAIKTNIPAGEKDTGAVGVFDVDCLNNGQGWVSLGDWITTVVPHLTCQYKRATGKWHITHAIEVER